MTDATADHERDPLPLGLIGWGVTLTMFGFGCWGYLTRAGAFSDDMSAQSAGWIVLAALSGIMQAAAAIGAKALRRSKNFNLSASKVLSGVLVLCGAVVTGCAVHNALEITGMDPLSSALIAIGVPVCEFSLWWVDESLASETAARRSAADAQSLQEARARDRGDTTDPDEIEYVALTDSALDALISSSTGIKRRAETERGRRRSHKIRVNDG